MFKKILLSLLSILIALTIGEIYLRSTGPADLLAEPAGDFSCYERGTYYWSRLKPNATCILRSNFDEFPDQTIHTNEQGLRNEKVTLTKSKGIKRILFIGDSFTFGWGVDVHETYPKVTESTLQKKGWNIEIINAGRPSTSPSNYYLYLLNDGLKFDPDIVVVGFDVFNDIANLQVNEFWAEKDSRNLPVKVDYPFMYIDSQGRLKDKSIPLKFTVPILKHSRIFAYATDTFFPKDPFVSQEKIDENEAKKRIKYLFKTMDEILNKKEKKLIVLMIPLSIQVDEEVRKMNNLSPFTSMSHPILDEFSNYFSENEINHINFLRYAVMSQQKNDLYYTEDGHWTAAGQKLAGEILSEKLLQ